MTTSERILKKNECEANLLVNRLLLAISICSVVYMIFACIFPNVAMVEISLLVPIVICGLFVRMPLFFYIRSAKGDGNMIKWFLAIYFLIYCTVIAIVFGKVYWLPFMAPVVVMTRYNNYKFVIKISIVTAVWGTLTSLGSLFLGLMTGSVNPSGIVFYKSTEISVSEGYNAFRTALRDYYGNIDIKTTVIVIIVESIVDVAILYALTLICVNIAKQGQRVIEDEISAAENEIILVKEYEEKREQEIMESLADDYSFVGLIYTSRNIIEVFRAYGIFSEYFDGLGENGYIIEPYVFDECLRSLISPEELDDFIKSVERNNMMKELGMIRHQHTDVQFGHGERREWYRITFVYLPESGNVVLGIKNVEKEITAEKRHQTELKTAKARAEAANAAKSTFLFNMSHDIRTPMNAITGFTGMAKKHMDDPERVLECLNKIELSSGNLLELINEVLDMSRIETGNISIKNESVNIVECVENQYTICRDIAYAKSIRIRLSNRNISCSRLMLDELHLKQTITNILSNAIKYTPDGGLIEYSLEQEPSPKGSGYVRCIIKVKDNGIGISKEFLSHIYDNFSREKNSTMSGVEGTGLGMAIVKRLVDLMGGEINIESELNKGTTVILTYDFEIADDSDAEKTKPVGGRISADGIKRILLVEDNEMNREIATDVMEDAGIEIEEAVDGDIAVEMISRSEPGYYNLVLMDIQMPRMNGYEATKAIRSLENKELASIPIIAMTANAFAEDREKSLAVGMNAHIAKPVSYESLFEAMGQLSNRS